MSSFSHLVITLGLPCLGMRGARDSLHTGDKETRWLGLVLWQALIQLRLVVAWSRIIASLFLDDCLDLLLWLALGKPFDNACSVLRRHLNLIVTWSNTVFLITSVCLLCVCLPDQLT